MKMMRFTVVLALLAFVAEGAEAQSDWFWGITYEVSAGTGETKDFVSGINFRNIGIDGRKTLGRNSSAGMHFGWNVLTSQDDQVIEFNNATITGGAQIRYINAFPMYANAHYYFGRRNSVRPYIGGNVGTIFEESRLDISVFALSDKAWHFAVAPEIGLIFPVDWHIKAHLSARYNYGFKASGRTVQYFTLGLGLAWN